MCWYLGTDIFLTNEVHMNHLRSEHRVTVALPIRQCQMLFTPAGEELWVDGWQPTYHYPADGSTQRGMVFSTGSGDELTFWSLVDFDRGPVRYYARYTRVTPALRSGFVEVECSVLEPDLTLVVVTYEMTAMTAAGVASLEGYKPENFVPMIEEWKSLVESKLPTLATANIR